MHRLHNAYHDDTTLSTVSKKARFVRQSRPSLGTCKIHDCGRKTEETESFADRKDMKKFHNPLKTIYGTKSSGATTLVSADGSTLLTDKDTILKR